jgi:hypothetical protein
MKWIPIEERLPPQDVVVIISEYDSRKNMEMYFVDTAYRLGEQWFETTHGEELKQKGSRVTHWMPLPDAPDVVV